MNSSISLYIHIPFCLSKCGYCDFHSHEIEDSKWHSVQEYVEFLLLEIAKIPSCKVRTIFFGGGTPSLLSGVQVTTLLSAIYEHFEVDEDAEISLEANPETLVSIVDKEDRERLEHYLSAGINRISLGCQSFDPDILKSLGRVHDVQTNFIAYDRIRRAGFKNVNIDLIFAIPGQSMESWNFTLVSALSLTPQHVALYNLTDDHGLEPVLNDEDLDLAMYRLAREVLKEHGYLHYEISNFAKPGFECKHNITYWRNEPYLGIGEGAVSSSTVHDYATTAMLGLRMLNEGVSLDRFIERHGIDFGKHYEAQIQELENLELLNCKEDSVTLTERGLELGNQIFQRFI